MDHITIQDLTVSFHVGVPSVERAKPQRLTLSIDMEHDFSGLGDEVERTIDYHAVSRRLQDFGRGRSWKLIESLAVDAAEMILTEFKAVRVTVEVKKFILPQAAYVSARASRPRQVPGAP